MGTTMNDIITLPLVRICFTYGIVDQPAEAGDLCPLCEGSECGVFALIRTPQ